MFMDEWTLGGQETPSPLASKNFTKGRFAHPTANRAITLREAARLQTFSDQYRFFEIMTKYLYK